MYCANCGKEIQGKRFCIYCGQEFSVEKNNEETRTKNKNGNKKTIIWCFIFAFVCILFWGIVNQVVELSTNIIQDIRPELSEMMVEEDLKETINWENLYNAPFQWETVNFSEVELVLDDKNSKIFAQEIYIEYTYFSRTIRYEVEYNYDDSDWEQGEISLCYDDVRLKDSINGTWRCEIEAGHPMHTDSYISIDIEKIDNYNCKYSFLKTSPVEGGREISFDQEDDILVYYDENGFLQKVEIANYNNNGNGDIVIVYEEVIYDPFMSQEYYLLEKQ